MILRPLFRLKPKEPLDVPGRWLVVGLGNPGSQYARTWHNSGFRALQALAGRHRIRVDRVKFKGLFGKGALGDKEAILLLPTTFMNLSGESVAEAMRFYRIPQERTIVLFDDVDIPLGTVRVRVSGGPGTHNGMKSVVSHIGNRDFPRIRIGIGDYVLGAIPDECKTAMDEAFARAADAVELILSSGIELAMNRINGK
jgi:PTH1 family peptidyl-tRNA hydrolase